MDDDNGKPRACPWGFIALYALRLFDMLPPHDILLRMEQFDSVLGTIELTDERKRHIFQFHPEVKALRTQFSNTLSQPDFMRRSRFDPKVFIFYRALPQKKYLAIAVKTDQRNFILTAYLTNKIQHLAL